jgi:hypothetical protein
VLLGLATVMVGSRNESFSFIAMLIGAWPRASSIPARAATGRVCSSASCALKGDAAAVAR